MVHEHEYCRHPVDRGQLLWRYLDFPKFVELLSSASLFFSRADKLGDPFEGSINELGRVRRLMAHSQMKSHYKASGIDFNFDGIDEDAEKISREQPRRTAVHCWYASDKESAAMWKLYAKGGEGVAIQSSFQLLYDCLNASHEQIFLTQVMYLDYSRVPVSYGNTLFPFTCKRDVFDYEREVRAIIQTWEGRKDLEEKFGVRVKIDLAQLIQAVYVSPEASTWFNDLVKTITTKFGYSFPVINSRMFGEPVY